MFEFSRNPKIALSVDNHFNECNLSQEKVVPTDQQTLLIHQYVLVESHCRVSVALWVHPLTLNITVSFYLISIKNNNKMGTGFPPTSDQIPQILALPIGPVKTHIRHI